jgi:hypothetical protein
MQMTVAMKIISYPDGEEIGEEEDKQGGGGDNSVNHDVVGGVDLYCCKKVRLGEKVSVNRIIRKAIAGFHT